MSDTAFERSLIALTCLVVAWIIAGIVLKLLGIVWVILIGLVVEIFGGGALLYYWGKNYMSRG